MNKHYSMVIESKTPPVVELDSEAHAAYVRFSNNKVARTKPLVMDQCIVTVDVDDADKIIGVEIIGVDEFGIDLLLEKAGISPLPQNLAHRARYISAKREYAMA